MNFLKTYFLAFFMGTLLFSIGCGPGEEDEENDDSIKKETPFSVPKFSSDSAYQFIEKQLSFGPRVPNSDAHKAAKDWLVEKFKSFDATVIEQGFQATAYNGTVLNGTNIIAQYNPQAKKRLLFAAHWDSRHVADSPINEERTKDPILAADDGGSGVAILLEIGRVLKENNLEKMGVDLILFDAEDYGDDNRENSNMDSWCLGSRYWSKNLHSENYRPKYGVLLDMVGSKGATFPKEGKSMRYAPQVVNKIWDLAQVLGYSNYFTNNRGEVGIDDHVPVNINARIPMIDVINMSQGTQTGFGLHWHTHNDNMDIISKKTLRIVGTVMLEVIYREEAGKL